MPVVRLLLVVTVLASWSVSVAAGELVPRYMRGIWVEANATECQDAQRIILVGASVVLVFKGDSTEERVVFGPASSVEGALLLVRPDGEIILETSFEKKERCDRLPSRYYALFGEALALFDAFDRIAQSCEQKSASDCLEAAFRFADVSEDGELGQAEISRVLRAFAFFVAYEAVVANRMTNEQKPTDLWEVLQVPVTNLAGSAALASLISPIFSDNLVKSYDFDGSGAVSLAELLQDRGPDDLVGAMGTLGSAAAQTGLQAIFGALQVLLGAMPGMMGSVLR